MSLVNRFKYYPRISKDYYKGIVSKPQKGRKEKFFFDKKYAKFRKKSCFRSARKFCRLIGSPSAFLPCAVCRPLSLCVWPIFRACQIIGVPEAALQVAASTRA